MRSYGSLSNTKAKEIHDVGAVGFIINSNADVKHAFLRAKYLGTLEVGTTSTKFIVVRHVEENLL
jgi:hypothetical protein